MTLYKPKEDSRNSICYLYKNIDDCTNWYRNAHSSTAKRDIPTISFETVNYLILIEKKEINVLNNFTINLGRVITSNGKFGWINLNYIEETVSKIHHDSLKYKQFSYHV